MFTRSRLRWHGHVERKDDMDCVKDNVNGREDSFCWQHTEHLADIYVCRLVYDEYQPMGRTGVRWRQATGKMQTQQNQESPPLNDDYDDDVGMLTRHEATQTLTSTARNIVDEMPSATSYSPLSLGRVKLLSSDELNILHDSKQHSVFV